MAELNIKLKVKTAWWLYPYLNTLALFCVVFGLEPDPEKLDRVIDRGLRLKVDSSISRQESD